MNPLAKYFNRRKLQIKILDKDLAPTRGHDIDAGLDLKINRDAVILPGSIVTVGTGIAVSVPVNHVGLVLPRSSMGKLNIALANTTGVIDPGYTGEIMLKLTNHGKKVQKLERGERVCQLVICKTTTKNVTVTELEQLNARGENGFGSTGTR